MADRFDLQLGDCRYVLQQYPDNFFDACVTDSPYGIGFMNKKWDTFKPGVESARVTTNHHAESDNPNLRGRTRGPASSPSAVEYDRSLAGQRGFQEWTESWAREVFRVLKPGAHFINFGAPRAHHRAWAGAEDAGFEIRDTLAWLFGQGFPKSLNLDGEWNGWGTALKPAFEPIMLARKPVDGTLTKNVQTWGTGALNIRATRIDSPDVDLSAVQNCKTKQGGHTVTLNIPGHSQATYNPEGRWPASLILDEDAATQLGDVSRYFYCPKVSRAEREFGCEHLPMRTASDMTGGREEGSAGINNPRAGAGRTSGSHNAHPTVKPIALMRWLVRLVTPPGGIIVDPFIGSGTTGIAAVLEGANIVGIDGELEWLTVADARIRAWQARELGDQAA
jgi:DNA modification methylase